MSERKRSFEEALEAHPAEVTGAELWEHTPQAIGELSAAWGKPLEGRAAQAMRLLILSGMTRGEVVMAVMQHRGDVTCSVL